MTTFDSICNECGTDKGSVHATAHDYARHYDRLFSKIRNEPVKLVEIGVGGGESIRAWLEYFPNAAVVGVDLIHDTNEWNVAGKKDRYTFVTGDQGDNTFWNCFAADYGGDWDIVVDDGSHMNKDIITTFSHLWKLVKPGGYYAIEDLAVGYGDGSVFVKEGFPKHMHWIKDFLDVINTGSTIDSMHFSRELCVITKAMAVSVVRRHELNSLVAETV